MGARRELMKDEGVRDMRAVGPLRGARTTCIVSAQEFRAGRLRLFYGESGRGAPVLLLHGLGASSRWWFPLFPELTAADYRIVAPDLPGFGRSPGRPLPFDEAALSLIELADRLGLDEFFLGGHSMGGAVAAQMAADYPSHVRRLVLINSAGIWRAAGQRAFGRLLQPWSWCPPWFYPTLIGDMLRAGPRSLMAASRYLRLYDIRPTLERVRAPTLIIWGEQDRLTPLDHGRDMARAHPNARLEKIPGARHLPMVSEPETVARLMLEFFAGAEGEGE